MRRNKKLISLIYWTHWLVAAASHVFGVFIVGGAITLVSSAPSLGFWIKGMLLGITFYCAMYAANHLTNKDSFCILTDLENHYRKRAGLSTVGEFTPRFYFQCRLIGRVVVRVFRRLK